MELGTVQIRKTRDGLYQVDWRNVGSCLAPIPRLYYTKYHAAQFARALGLRLTRSDD